MSKRCLQYLYIYILMPTIIIFIIIIIYHCICAECMQNKNNKAKKIFTIISELLMHIFSKLYKIKIIILLFKKIENCWSRFWIRVLPLSKEIVNCILHHDVSLTFYFLHIFIKSVETIHHNRIYLCLFYFLRIEDLVNKGTDLQKYKADAEHKTSTLMNSLREKDTENEALREQLARLKVLWMIEIHI